MSTFDDQTDTSNIQPSFRINWRDLMAIVINIAFALIGLLLLPSEPDVGIVTLAFFGSGGFLLGWLQWQRYLDHKISLTSVDVVGGVPLRTQRGFMLVMGTWLFVLGGVLTVFGARYSILFQGLAVFVAVCGLSVTVLAMLGLAPAGFLQFEPDGLIIGQRGWQVLVPWDCIYAVQETELHNNPIIRLGVDDIEDLVISPSSAEAKARKIMMNSSIWTWGPFVIFPMHYGIATPVLAEAIKHYARDANARQNLSKRLLTAPAASS